MASPNSENNVDNDPSPETSDAEPAKKDLPIDRGYAYVVMIATYIIAVVFIGYPRSFGIIFVELLRRFEAPTSTTALVVGIQWLFSSVGGFVTQTVLLSYISGRTAVIIGGIFNGAGIVLTVFADNLGLVILTQSVIIGIGSGLIGGPAVSLICQYFESKRAIAMGFVASGASFGGLVVPPLMRLLLDEYGLNGALLVYGALSFNVVVCGALLRPLQSFSGKSSNSKGHIFTEDSKPLMKAEKSCRDQDNTSRRAQSLDDNMENDSQTDCLQDQKKISEKTPEDFYMRSWHSAPVVLDSPASCHPRPLQSLPDVGGEKPQDQEELPLIEGRRHISKTHLKDLSEERRDRTEISKNLPMAENISTNDDVRRLACRGCWTIIWDLFDLSLFKHPHFYIVQLSVFFCFMPAILARVYLPALAESINLTDLEASHCLMAYSATSILSRIIMGFLVDNKILSMKTLFVSSITVAGIGLQLTRLLHSYGLLMAFSAFEGCFIDVIFLFLPLIIVEYLGKDRFTKAYGFVLLIQGFTLMAASPLTGLIRDVTGGYDAVYHFLGVCNFLAAIVLVLEPLIAKYRNAS